MRWRPALLALLLLGLAGPARAWEDSSLGLRLPDPKGWEVRTGSEKGALVRYYAPPGPGPRPSLGLSARELGEVEVLTRDQVHEAVRTLAAELPKFELLASRATEVQGLPAHRLSFRAELSGHAFQASQVLLVRGGRLLVFTLTTPTDRHQELLPVLDRTVKGMRFDGAPAGP